MCPLFYFTSAITSFGVFMWDPYNNKGSSSLKITLYLLGHILLREREGVGSARNLFSVFQQPGKTWEREMLCNVQGGPSTTTLLFILNHPGGKEVHSWSLCGFLSLISKCHHRIHWSSCEKLLKKNLVNESRLCQLLFKAWRCRALRLSLECFPRLSWVAGHAFLRTWEWRLRSSLEILRESKRSYPRVLLNPWPRQHKHCAQWNPRLVGLGALRTLPTVYESHLKHPSMRPRLGELHFYLVSIR